MTDKKRKRSSSSPPTLRICMREDFYLNEEEVSDAEPIEQLRSLEDPVSSAEERLEASLVPENRQVESVKSIDWNEEIERLEVNLKEDNMEEVAKGKQPGIDWSQVPDYSETDYSEGPNEGKIRRYKIGGVFLERNKGKKSFNETDTGTVWLAEDQTLEMRSGNDNLTSYFDIEEVKQFTKETFKEEQVDFIM